MYKNTFTFYHIIIHPHHLSHQRLVIKRKRRKELASPLGDDQRVLSNAKPHPDLFSEYLTIFANILFHTNILFSTNNLTFYTNVLTFHNLFLNKYFPHSIRDHLEIIQKRKCLLAPPRGVAIRTYWPPLGAVNKDLLAPPPPNYFLDDAVLFHSNQKHYQFLPQVANAGLPPPCPHSWQADCQAC